MSGLSPVWSVRKSGVDYVLDADNQLITYRKSNPSEAFLQFNNSDRSVMSIFSEEDEVQLKIGNVVMMDGYIDDITDVRKSTGHLDLTLHLMDWGSYLASKMSFEKNYLKTVIGQQAFIDSAAKISGLSTAGVTGLNTANENIKRDFSGTYVKDIWDDVAQNAGADYFVDVDAAGNNKTLQAFPFGSRDLNASNGLRYVIRDIAPTQVNHIQARLDNDLKFIRDVSGKYRNVIVTNGLDDTFPIDIDLAVTQKLLHPIINKECSAFFGAFGSILSDYPGTTQPFKFLLNEDIQGLVSPTLQIIMPNSSAQAGFSIGGRTFDSSGNPIITPFSITLTDWQSLRFIMKNALTGVSVTSITLRIVTTGGGSWTRDIYPDLIDQNGNRNNFVSLQYGLPTGILDFSGKSNGWTPTVFPVPTTIMTAMTLAMNPINGYTVNSYLEFAKWFLYRKQRRTATSAGTPATEKIIVNAAMTNPTSLQNFANKELSRVQNTARKPDFTIDGNTDFRKPGYNIDVDFSTTFDANRRTTTGIIIDEIRHKLIAGVHYTDIFLDTSFNRK